MIMRLRKEEVLPIIINALREDIGSGDITTDLLFDGDLYGRAKIIANEKCIVAGIEVVKWIVDSLNEKIEFISLCQDGDEIKKGKVILSVKGPLRAILAGERVILNFLGRLSGIATLTSRFVNEVKGTPTKIFDTRKTTPGLRILEKYAVGLGKGKNHRMGLWDGILIKDNHINALRLSKGKGALSSDVIREAIIKIKNRGYNNIEIEVSNVTEFEEAIDVGADIIMLDNMDLEKIREIVRIRKRMEKETKRKIILEVSGGITLENVRKIARLGVDRISIGALTHSARSIDFSLEVQELISAQCSS